MKKFLLVLLFAAMQQAFVFSQNTGNNFNENTEFQHRLQHQQPDSIFKPTHNSKNKNQNPKLTTVYKPEIITVYSTGGTQRNTYTYDTNGNKLTGLNEKWTNNVWVNYLKYTYTYDTNGNKLTELNEKWTNDTWVNYLKYTYTYDRNVNQLTELNEIWTNNTWVNSYKITSTYDIKGNQLTQLNEKWTNNSWVNYWKYTNTYDTNDNQLTELYEIWSTDAWSNSTKYTRTYDTNGNMLTLLNEYWTNNAWVSYSIFTFTYDSNGNIITRLEELWTNNAWVNYDKFTNTYHTNGNWLTRLTESWSNNAWVNNSKIINTYDANRNTTLCESFNWNSTSNIWEQTNNGGIYILTNGNFYQSFYGIKVETQWKQFEVSGITPVQSNTNITLSPNPAKDVLKINGTNTQSSAVIYTIEGKQIQTINNTNNEINISQLNKGIYFIKINTGNAVQSLKFIKE